MGRPPLGRLRLPLLLAFTSCLAEQRGSLEVRVRPNGASWEEAGRTYSAESLESLREQVAKNEDWALLGPEWWLADLEGFNLTAWETLEVRPQEQRVLSVVPSGRLFQWGPRRIGERFAVDLEGFGAVELETVAHSPRIFLIHNLFTENESLYLIERAMARTGESALKTSGVGFQAHGAGEMNIRTSASAFDSASATSKLLIERCFKALRVPYVQSMADGLQILRYQEGQAYFSHTDWFDVDTRPGFDFDPRMAGGSNRYATVFLYLHPPPSGGYTVFPEATIEEGLRDNAFVSTGRDVGARNAAMLHAHSFYKNESSWEVELTADCYTQLSVKPVRLGAALFYHQEPMTGELQEVATHGACPSLTGTKWGANLWVWNRARHQLPEKERMQNTHAIFVNREPFEILLEFSMDEGLTWSLFSQIPRLGQSSADTWEGHFWRFARSDTRQEVRRWVVPDGSGGSKQVVGTDFADEQREL